MWILIWQSWILQDHRWMGGKIMFRGNAAIQAADQWGRMRTGIKGAAEGRSLHVWQRRISVWDSARPSKSSASAMYWKSHDHPVFLVPIQHFATLWSQAKKAACGRTLCSRRGLSVFPHALYLFYSASIRAYILTGYKPGLCPDILSLPRADFKVVFGSGVTDRKASGDNDQY